MALKAENPILRKMPFFPRKTPTKEELKDVGYGNLPGKPNGPPQFLSPNEEINEKQKLIFHCQQAQGSPTGVITGFSNVKELYQRISECYDFEPSEILFCTLNTHKINMNKLLGAQIALGDFIFVHRKGRPKEIELKKTENSLGLTITDNGNGLAFIKRIKENSVIDHVPVIQVGDHIEKVNSESLVGKRHFEVAKFLRDIPLGSTFTMRLISPLQAGFSNIGPRERTKGKKLVYGSGKETLRFRANGQAVVEEVDDKQEKAVEGINVVLENFLGINDSELATRIWELSDGIKNSVDFAEVISNSDVGELCFTDDFVIELWGVVTDVRDGRIR